MPVMTRGRCRLGSGTETFSTRCVTPSWHRRGSKTSGAIRQPFPLYDASFNDLELLTRCADGSHRQEPPKCISEHFRSITRTCGRFRCILSLLGKAARSLAPDHERAEDLVCADQWHNEARSIAGLHSDFSQRTWRLVTYIGGLLRLFVLGRLAGG